MASSYANLLEQKKVFTREKGSIPTVSLFWDTNMAAVMSFENALLTFMQYFLGFLCVNYLSYLLKLSNENYLNPTSYEVIFFSHHTSILYQKGPAVVPRFETCGKRVKKQDFIHG